MNNTHWTDQELPGDDARSRTRADAMDHQGIAPGKGICFRCGDPASNSIVRALFFARLSFPKAQNDGGRHVMRKVEIRFCPV